MLRRAMKLADQRRGAGMLVERASGVYHVETFRLVEPYLNNPRIAQTACYTIVNLSHHAEIRRAQRGRVLPRLGSGDADFHDSVAGSRGEAEQALGPDEWVAQEMVKVERPCPSTRRPSR